MHKKNVAQIFTLSSVIQIVEDKFVQRGIWRTKIQKRFNKMIPDKITSPAIKIHQTFSS